jgi:hypothetical protein
MHSLKIDETYRHMCDSNGRILKEVTVSDTVKFSENYSALISPYVQWSQGSTSVSCWQCMVDRRKVIPGVN